MCVCGGVAYFKKCLLAVLQPPRHEVGSGQVEQYIRVVETVELLQTVLVLRGKGKGSRTERKREGFSY